jgi:putative tryptophan/tyrosine transport system substrate-binding protein
MRAGWSADLRATIFCLEQLVGMRWPMNRHGFAILILSLAVVLSPQARAQKSPPILIGVLEGASEVTMAARYDAFRSQLRELGYVEGVDVRFEYRYADGILGRLPALAAELVRLQPRVIVSAPVPANIAMSKATSTIPIVMATGADPVTFGIVNSLSHPGGNITGVTNFAEDLASKQIDIIRELLPRLARIGTIVNVENPLHVPQWQETQDAAAKASLALVRFDYRNPDDLERAFAQFAQDKVEAVLVPPDVAFSALRVRIAKLAEQARLPTIFFNREAVVAGGLLGYGPDIVENYRRAAIFVDKILKGAKPGDLPIERPNAIDLVINLGTARLLGLTIPPTLLARANAVVE